MDAQGIRVIGLQSFKSDERNGRELLSSKHAPRLAKNAEMFYRSIPLTLTIVVPFVAEYKADKLIAVLLSPILHRSCRHSSTR
jgi:hypothetical protein